MNDDELISCIKKVWIDGKKIGELSTESGVSRRTIQNILRKKGAISMIVRMRLEEYFQKVLA